MGWRVVGLESKRVGVLGFIHASGKRGRESTKDLQAGI